jgi:hypothetical protein
MSAHAKRYFIDRVVHGKSKEDIFDENDLLSELKKLNVELSKGV